MLAESNRYDISALVPVSMRLPRVSTKHLMLATAALGAALPVLIGFYPQFDEGELRPWIAMTTAGLAATVMSIALRTQSRFTAGGATVGLAAVFGVLNTIIPSILLVAQHPNRDAVSQFGGCMMFGIMFGIPTGLFFGLILSILSVIVYEPTTKQTSLAAVDRARIRAGIWLLPILSAAIAGGSALKAPAYSLIVTMVFAVLAAAVSIHAAIRSFMRTRWTTRIAQHSDPCFQTRALVETDPADLPRLGDGTTVVEWCPRGGTGTDAYRTSAAGVPIAIY